MTAPAPRAAPFDPVAIVVDAIAESDDPRHVPHYVAFVSQLQHYPAAVLRIERELVPDAKAGKTFGGRRLAVTILNRGVFGITRVFRIAVDLGFVDPRAQNANECRPAVSVDDLIAATDGGRKFKKAFVALAALGFVRSPRGMIAVEETSFDCPGIWPAAPSERLALALNLIVRTAMAGERFDFIHLVRS